jgi:hypothetical protein
MSHHDPLDLADAEIIRLKETVETLSTALKPFASLYNFVKIMEDNLEIDPVTDDSVVFSLKGMMLGVQITAGDLRKAADAIGATIKLPIEYGPADDTNGEEIPF